MSSQQAKGGCASVLNSPFQNVAPHGGQAASKAILPEICLHPEGLYGCFSEFKCFEVLSISILRYTSSLQFFH